MAEDIWLDVETRVGNEKGRPFYLDYREEDVSSSEKNTVPKVGRILSM